MRIVSIAAMDIHSSWQIDLGNILQKEGQEREREREREREIVLF